MYCKNCGEKLNSNSNFCTNCGTKVYNSENIKKNMIIDDKIKYQLKPTFNWIYKIFIENRKYLAQVIIFIILAIVLLFVPNRPKGAILFVIFMISYIIIKNVINLVIEKIQYNNYQYNFYKTKIEYKDGFWDKVQKELKYKHVREVVMSESFIERLFGIGTIAIYTNASNLGNGIFIHCVKNVEEQYKIIKQIIDEGTDI